jgi:alkylation response protein AidB-like acyl-CoA dehydrogenase
MAFFQEPPRLGNTFDADPLLRSFLARRLAPDHLRAVEEELRHLGALAGGPLFALQSADRLNEPVLTAWDAWGNRIDHIEVTPLWKEAARLAAVHGLVAVAYERKHGAASRIDQFARAYLLEPSLDVYSCPLAMTDGAARTLTDLASADNRAVVERAVPRLTSRDPDRMWTSGQWMTERTGGSDVGLSETVARKDGETWRLYGTKWFTSATTSQMTLTLGRPEGNGPGGRGLALFYLELRDEEGRLRNISINRLKDKLGTRKVPTAELTLDGAPAVPLAGLADGVRNISSMLNVTRTWNATMSASGMRRGVMLAQDYARRRVAFGARLCDKPLHVDTLAGLEAEAAGAFLLSFEVVRLLGKREAGEASDEEQALFRLLTPIAKLVTGKQAVAVASECLEAFGGAGYVEDTGLPRLLRDAQVLPIWEGTTNVLSLDTLRALGGTGAAEALRRALAREIAAITDPSLAGVAQAVARTAERLTGWLSERLGKPETLEAGARRFALTLGRTYELALLGAHASWCAENGQGGRAAAAARRFLRHGVDLLDDDDLEDARILAGA